jgi:putative MFS transporter
VFPEGLGAGGMLPITFTLIAETMPARHRGCLMVLIGGDAAAAYVITGWLAGTALLVADPLADRPAHGPAAGLAQPLDPRVTTLLDRVGPRRRSPDHYGHLRRGDARWPGARAVGETRTDSHYWRLLRPPFVGITLAVGVLGLAVGLITYGFQLWNPMNL